MKTVRCISRPPFRLTFNHSREPLAMASRWTPAPQTADMNSSIKRVKFILPALTEATSPYWRPIKYSLFPPLGLATLAAYLDPGVEISLQDEHVEKLDRSEERRVGKECRSRW